MYSAASFEWWLIKYKYITLKNVEYYTKDWKYVQQNHYIVILDSFNRNSPRWTRAITWLWILLPRKTFIGKDNESRRLFSPIYSMHIGLSLDLIDEEVAVIGPIWAELPVTAWRFHWNWITARLLWLWHFVMQVIWDSSEAIMNFKNAFKTFIFMAV